MGDGGQYVTQENQHPRAKVLKFRMSLSFYGGSGDMLDPEKLSGLSHKSEPLTSGVGC